jgi:LPS export ABC transporter protein LptC
MKRKMKTYKPTSHQIRRIIIAILFLLGGSIVYFLAWPSNYAIKANNISFMGSDADLTIDRMHVIQNKQGAKDWEMWADSAKIYHKKNITILESIRIRFYPKKGKPIDITADSGEMENDSRNMSIRGHVLIQTSEGYALRTERLRFRPKEKKFDTDDKILLKGNSFNLTGTGLHGETDKGLFKLDEQVKAVIYNRSSNTFAAASEQAAPPAKASPPEGSMP